ncbi:hypothetical protein K2173_026343 [Erythroxylum novogranatense]|uniref:H15 domain-containing protein n=1 Tax=Erythroxylum novogranatense TaxID=1862640 RepID=A0AAV8SMX9_9ROSI|nr:hypothetical protein K2173_026343 [Erythroxylum novogranatense]
MDPLLAPPSVPPPSLTTTVAAVMDQLAPSPLSAAEVPHNHIHHATPSISPSLPPYAEMIYAAITALKERDGSSKRAIAKYIEKAYTDLPPTHSTLLTHHLKRLKNSGLLVMVKKSYKLPRSDFSTTSAHDYVNSTSSTTATNDPSYGQKRGRGRPPKPKLGSLPDSNGQSIPQQPQPYSVTFSQDQQQPVLGSTGFFPPVVQTETVTTTAAETSNTQPVLVALGLADEPKEAKRGRGRPKKSSVVAQAGGQVVVVKKGRGRPPKSPGRPRKPKSVMAAQNGVKRGRGRPPKAQSHSVAVTYAADGTLISVARPRGRPRKAVAPATPRKSTGRPVGRPRKNTNMSWITTEQSQTQAQAEVADLKMKLEFFQSRVRQAVGLLRPQLSSETGMISVMTAIQELEGLASLDVNAPLREDPLPPVVQT